MNLMIVLVPILLMSLIFAQTSIIQLNFPEADSAAAIDPEQVDLRVAIYEDSIDVLEGANTLIKRIENGKEGFDQGELSVIMQELKKRLPDVRSISLLARPDTSYQSLIAVMDSVSSYKAVVAGSVVRAELFPDIGISDAPTDRIDGDITP